MYSAGLHAFQESGPVYYYDSEKFNNCTNHAYGIFYDLTDSPSTATEGFDALGGFTFAQLYGLLNVNDYSLCDYIINRIYPICVTNGTTTQLIHMVDRNPNGGVPIYGHSLVCWT